MTKTYCDRCGKEIKYWKAKIWHRQKTVSLRLMASKRENEDHITTIDQDICPECEDSFIHWFMHPEEEREEHDDPAV